MSASGTSRGAVPFTVLLAAWSLLSYPRLIDPVFLPTPTRVIITLVQLFYQADFITDLAVSTGRILSGFGVAAVLAVPIGVLMANSLTLDRTLRPFLGFTRYLPVSAFVPLLILWSGIGFSQKLWIIFLGVFFHLALLIADDASRVPRAVLDSAKTLSATAWQTAFWIRLPYSLPAIFDDLRIMLGAAWTYLVVAELVAADSGIGRMIIDSQRFLRTDRVIACILAVGMIGILSDLFFRIVTATVAPWSRL